VTHMHGPPSRAFPGQRARRGVVERDERAKDLHSCSDECASSSESAKKHPPCTVMTMAQTLAELIAEITLDAYDLYEQLSGLLQVFSDEVTVPASGAVLDFPVEVTGFDFEGDERRGLVAQCEHGRVVGAVSLVDVRFEPHSVAGWLHATYRSWLGRPPFPALRPSDWSCPST
jgi:hypothetical protein